MPLETEFAIKIGHKKNNVSHL